MSCKGSKFAMIATVVLTTSFTAVARENGASLAPRKLLSKPQGTIVLPNHDPQTFMVKFADDLGVSVGDTLAGQLRVPEGSMPIDESSAIEWVSTFGEWSRLSAPPALAVERIRQTAIRNSGAEMFDFSMLFSFTLSSPDVTRVAELCDALNELGSVELAFPVPRGPSEPISPTPDLNNGTKPQLAEANSSSYPNDDPRAIWDRRGITGEGVAIWLVDFNLARDATNGQDLPVFLADVPILTEFEGVVFQHVPVTYNGRTDGGAEAVRIAGAPRDGTGTEGPAFSSHYYFAPIVWGQNVIGEGEELASPWNAILTVLSHPSISEGDVILVPMAIAGPYSDNNQAHNWAFASPGIPGQSGPGYWYPDYCQYEIGTVPIEWDYLTHQAMVQAFFNNILVVEAAGDGATSLDDPEFLNWNHKPFTEDPSYAVIVTASGSYATTNTGSRINFWDDGTPPPFARYECSRGSHAAAARVAAKAALIQSHFKLTGASEATFDPSNPFPGRTGNYLPPADLANLLYATGGSQIPGRGRKPNVLHAVDELLKDVDVPRSRMQSLLPNLQLLTMSPSGPPEGDILLLGSFDPDHLPVQTELRVYNDSDVRQCVRIASRSGFNGTPDPDLVYELGIGSVDRRSFRDINITVPESAPPQFLDYLTIWMNDYSRDASCTDEQTYREFEYGVLGSTSSPTTGDRRLEVYLPHHAFLSVSPNSILPFPPTRQGESEEILVSLGILPGSPVTSTVRVDSIELVGDGPFELVQEVWQLPTPSDPWRILWNSSISFRIRLNGSDPGHYSQLLRIHSSDPEFEIYEVYLAANVTPRTGGIEFEHLGGRVVADGLIDLGAIDYDRISFPFNQRFHRFMTRLISNIGGPIITLEDLDLVYMPPGIPLVAEGLVSAASNETTPPNVAQDLFISIQQAARPQAVGWYRGGVIANYRDITGQEHQAEFELTFVIEAQANLPVSIRANPSSNNATSRTPEESALYENGDEIDFGAVVRGGEARQQISLTNTSSQPIRVISTAVEAGPFGMLQPFPSIELPPGVQAAAFVGLDTSNVGVKRGRLSAYLEGVNSPLDNPFVTVDLLGEVEVGFPDGILQVTDAENELIADGSRIELGELLLGAPSHQWHHGQFVIKNVGTRNLHYSVDLSGASEIEIVGSWPGGLLEVGEVKIFEYRVSQSNPGDFYTFVDISNSGPNENYRFTLHADVNENAPQPVPPTSPPPGPPGTPPVGCYPTFPNEGPNLPLTNAPTGADCIYFRWHNPPYSPHTGLTHVPMLSGSVLDFGSWPVGSSSPWFDLRLVNRAIDEQINGGHGYRGVYWAASSIRAWNQTTGHWNTVWQHPEHHTGTPIPPGGSFVGDEAVDDDISDTLLGRWGYNDDPHLATIRFEPQVVGEVVALYTINYVYRWAGISHTGLVYLYLRGEGVPDAPRLAAASNLGFGYQHVDNMPVHRNIQYCNQGTQDLEVSQIYFAEPWSAAFWPFTAGPHTIQPDECRFFQVQFQTNAVGEHSAEVVIESNDPYQPELRVLVTGTAVDTLPARPVLKHLGQTLAPGDTLTFSGTPVNGGVEAISLQFCNEGEDPFYPQWGSGVCFQQSCSAEFNEVFSMPASIPGDTCYAYRIEFDPAEAGLRHGIFQVVTTENVELPQPGGICNVVSGSNAPVTRCFYRLNLEGEGLN